MVIPPKPQKHWSYSSGLVEVEVVVLVEVWSRSRTVDVFVLGAACGKFARFFSSVLVLYLCRDAGVCCAGVGLAFFGAPVLSF
jgi:hypothetical protein